MILNKPITEWPKVDALISFYSSGFPLKKAQMYVEMHKPYQINDLNKQEILFDRRRIYQELTKLNIPTAKYHFVIRDPKENILSRYLEEEAPVKKAEFPMFKENEIFN